MKYYTSERVSGAFSIILLGSDEQGGEASLVLANPPEGVDIYEAAESGNTITASEIVGWFDRAGASARLPSPQFDDVKGLVRDFNILRVTADHAYRDRLRHKRLENVRRALDVLGCELPLLLDDVGKFFGDDSYLIPQAQRDAAQRLNSAVAEAVAAFQFTGPRKRRQPWHDRADYLAMWACAYWRKAGARRLGVGKPTSPPVQFAALALARLGDRDGTNVPITPDAIAKALSRRKKDPVGHRNLLVETPPIELWGQLLP